LDVSKNTALTSLNCGRNQLTSLDLSKNTALTYLDCDGNQLMSLDVSKNTALYYLGCDESQLTSLDVSKNTALDELDCHSNKLTSLNVSKNIALTQLYCQGNLLTSLDVSKNTALEVLGCSGNQLTSMDLSKNTALYDYDPEWEEKPKKEAIIGKPIRIGSIEVAQNDFSYINQMNWYDAAKACTDLGNGWRLPTKYELNFMYDNKDKFGGFTSYGYWSTAEDDNGGAWKHYFGSNTQGYFSKDETCNVRAVRSF